MLEHILSAAFLIESCKRPKKVPFDRSIKTIGFTRRDLINGAGMEQIGSEMYQAFLVQDLVIAIGHLTRLVH